MPRDLKVGMVLGVVVVTAALVWLCGRKELSLEARIEQSNSGQVQQQIEPGRLSSNSQQRPPAENSNSSQSAGETFNQVKGATQEVKVPQTKRVHVVQAGESLSSISAKYYGTIKRVEDIKKANRDVIKKNDMIFPGMKLVVP